jgi:hypothetical protein
VQKATTRRPNQITRPPRIISARTGRCATLAQTNKYSATCAKRRTDCTNVRCISTLCKRSFIVNRCRCARPGPSNDIIGPIIHNNKTNLHNAYRQGDLHLPGHDTDQRQCAMEWPTTVWQHCFTNI